MPRADDATLPQGDRGNLAIVILVVFGTIVVGAFLWVLLNESATLLFDLAENASNTTDSGQGLSDARETWDMARALVLVLVFVLGLAGAAATSGRRP